RGFHVTGVQTCALPISYIAGVVTRKPGDRKALDGLKEQLREAIGNLALERERAEAEKAKAVKEASDRAWDEATLEAKKSGGAARSEERRAGAVGRRRRA